MAFPDRQTSVLAPGNSATKPSGIGQDSTTGGRVFWGFLACFTATFARALKSVLQGLLLTNENERLDSLNLLLFMSPSALGKSI